MFKTTIAIEGMKYEKCEAKVNNLLKSNFKVASVTSSHSESSTVVESKLKLDEEKIKSLIADTGFTVTGITVEETKKACFLKKLILFLFFDYPLK